IGAGTALAVLFLQVFTVQGIELTYDLHWQGLVITALVGLALTWLASLAPAMRAASKPPVEPLRQVS
ncbi:MAG: hypothetical protein Q3965_04590, partial [Rothia sp. (in: high G+C Gram-positive bacteria)]|nr:hypothetical protein [Rothia sp. (in: high G+C Gram-positive bacteria)]